MHSNPINSGIPCSGKNPKDRSIEELLVSGTVVIDKPRGPSSHQVAEWAKNILGAGKAGHLGTLDSDVSGVLPVLLGRATNATAYLMKHDKRYVGIVRFSEEVTEKDVKKLFIEFTGEIWQIPPIGAAVARKRRKRMIYSLELLEIDGKDVLFDVKCEAGTYIRTLAEDMGKKIGNNARLTELRRVEVGGFGEKDAVTLQELSDAVWLWKEKGDGNRLKGIIHPIEDALKGFKRIWIMDKAADAICHGAQLMMPGIKRFEAGINVGDLVAIMNMKDELVAFAEAKISSKDMQTSERGQATKTERVISRG
jgi:H/ACA ribonucleoprotein complex subunit 4